MTAPDTLAPLTGSAPATTGEEFRALVRLAGPLVGANLLQMAVAAVDVIFVARLGTVELAAATLGVFLFNVLMYATIGLTTAAAPLIAAELGRRKHAVREVRRSFRMALWVGAAAAVVVMAILWNGEALLRLADQDPDVARRSGHFLRILLIGIVPAIAAAVMRTAAAALGRPGWAFGVTGMALAFSIVANWCLVFGNAGFPRLGLEGSALASVLSLSAMAIAYWLILHFDPRLRRYRLFGRWWRSEWSRFREITQLGLPIALTWMAEGALFGGASLLMGILGVKEVAAHAVALNIASLTFQVPLGVAQAATIRVGMAFGARDHAGSRARAGWRWRSARAAWRSARSRCGSRPGCSSAPISTWATRRTRRSCGSRSAISPWRRCSSSSMACRWWRRRICAGCRIRACRCWWRCSVIGWSASAPRSRWASARHSRGSASGWGWRPGCWWSRSC